MTLKERYEQSLKFAQETFKELPEGQRDAELHVVNQFQLALMAGLPLDMFSPAQLKVVSRYSLTGAAFLFKDDPVHKDTPFSEELAQDISGELDMVEMMGIMNSKGDKIDA